MQADALVVFGASGHLALNMLFPSLYNLEADKLLGDEFRIHGAARLANIAFRIVRLYGQIPGARCYRAAA